MDALLGVALPDLPQRLILVPALPHVLIVDDVIVGPLALVSGLGQLTGQSRQPLYTLILLSLGDPFLLVAVVQDALAGQVSTVARVVCTLLLQALLDVVAHGLVHAGRWGWGRRHHQVQLLLRLHQVILGFLGLQKQINRQ